MVAKRFRCLAGDVAALSVKTESICEPSKDHFSVPGLLAGVMWNASPTTSAFCYKKERGAAIPDLHW